MESAAIVVMAKTLIKGQVKTRLCPPLTPKQALDLQVAMLADTIARIALIDGISPYLAYGESGDETQDLKSLPSGWTVIAQGSGDLGQRLQNISRDLLAKHPQLLIIGADSPTLPMEMITGAMVILKTHGSIVIAGSDDGGYCLIGMNDAHPEIFTDIDWSTDKVMEQTLSKALETDAKVIRLPDWYDVDDSQSLERLIGELESDPSAAPQTAKVISEI